jgi:hypothetical protein
LTRPRAAAACTVLALLASTPRTALAQVGLPVGGEHRSFHFEVTKPFFDDPGYFDGTRLPSTIWDASLAWPLEGGPTLFARTGLSFGMRRDAGMRATFAKPRVGALLGRSGLHVEIHADLPLLIELGDEPNYATEMGMYGDWEELERFARDRWSVGASASAETELDPGSFVGIRLGTTLLVSTLDGVDAELFVTHALFGHVPAGRSRLHIEFSGLVLATESGADPSERTYFFATLMLRRPETRFQPDFYVRAPIDNGLEGILNFSLGVRVHPGL